MSGLAPTNELITRALHHRLTQIPGRPAHRFRVREGGIWIPCAWPNLSAEFVAGPLLQLKHGRKGQFSLDPKKTSRTLAGMWKRKVVIKLTLAFVVGAHFYLTEAIFNDLTAPIIRASRRPLVTIDLAHPNSLDPAVDYLVRYAELFA